MPPRNIGLRARFVEQELPAVVGEIRNDVLRQIGMPLLASLGVANNTFLHAWEREDLAEAGKRTRATSGCTISSPAASSMTSTSSATSPQRSR